MPGTDDAGEAADPAPMDLPRARSARGSYVPTGSIFQSRSRDLHKSFTRPWPVCCQPHSQRNRPSYAARGTAPASLGLSCLSRWLFGMEQSPQNPNK